MSVMALDRVAQALEPFAVGFRADGAELVIEEASDEAVRIRLVTSPETCLECILSAEVITPILEAAVRNVYPGFSRFTFVDTRQPSG